MLSHAIQTLGDNVSNIYSSKEATRRHVLYGKRPNALKIYIPMGTGCRDQDDRRKALLAYHSRGRGVIASDARKQKLGIIMAVTRYCVSNDLRNTHPIDTKKLRRCRIALVYFRLVIRSEAIRHRSHIDRLKQFPFLTPRKLVSPSERFILTITKRALLVRCHPLLSVTRYKERRYR